jgi:hypothetical protein
MVSEQEWQLQKEGKSLMAEEQGAGKFSALNI